MSTNSAALLFTTMAQVNGVSTHNKGADHTFVDTKNPAPQNLNLSALGLTGGTATKEVAANTAYNRPVPSKENALT